LPLQQTAIYVLSSSPAPDVKLEPTTSTLKRKGKNVYSIFRTIMVTIIDCFITNQKVNRTKNITCPIRIFSFASMYLRAVPWKHCQWFGHKLGYRSLEWLLYNRLEHPLLVVYQ
jgi:hypothetical protein